MERRELTGAHNKAEKLQTWTSPRGTHPWPPKQTLSLEASESSYAWSYKPHQLSSWVSFWLMTFFFFLAALGLCFGVQAFPTCGMQASFVVEPWL